MRSRSRVRFAQLCDNRGLSKQELMDISVSPRVGAQIVCQPSPIRRSTMSRLTIALLGAAATLVAATPTYAQNFNGFGAPNDVIEGYQTPTQQKPVVLKRNVVKPAK